MRQPFRSRFPKPTSAGLLVGLVALVASSAGAAGDPFSVQRISSTGRTVTAALADLDGDGRQDLLQAVTFGMPPDERRVVRVYPQDAEGRIPDTPALEFAIAPRTAAYDIADVAGGPGSELLMLRPRGIEVISFERGPSGALEVRRNEARIPEDLTIGVSNDERGLDRLAMANFDFPSGPVLIAPGLGETFFLSPDGTLRARIESGSRAAIRRRSIAQSSTPSRSAWKQIATRTPPTRCRERAGATEAPRACAETSGSSARA